MLQTHEISTWIICIKYIIFGILRWKISNLLKNSIWHDVLFLIWSMHYNTFLTYQGSSMSILNCKTQWVSYSSPQGVRSLIRNTFWWDSFIAAYIMVTDIKKNNLFFYWIRILQFKNKIYYIPDINTFKKKSSVIKYLIRRISTYFKLPLFYKISSIICFKSFLRFLHLLILF